jgi:hypothetical protein
VLCWKNRISQKLGLLGVQKEGTLIDRMVANLGRPWIGEWFIITQKVCISRPCTSDPCKWLVVG